MTNINPDLIRMGFTKDDLKLILECIECRLHLMDQENQWFMEEPNEPYYQLVEIAEFISGFTDEKESI
jgi:hypothetical protein